MRCEYCGIIEACCEGGPSDIPAVDFDSAPEDELRENKKPL
jgi:hypothetical protein